MDASHVFVRYSPLTFVISLLTGCALIQDDPGEEPIVNPQQAQLAQGIHLANSGLAGGPAWWEGYHDPLQHAGKPRLQKKFADHVGGAATHLMKSQSTVELAQSAWAQATAVVAQNRMRITDKSFSWSLTPILCRWIKRPVVHAQYLRASAQR